MKTQYYVALISIFLSHSPVFSLNNEVDEQINSPLSTTKVLTKTWDDEVLKSQEVNNYNVRSQPKKLKIQSVLCTPCAEQTEQTDRLPNIIVENGIFKEKISEERRKYWIDEDE